MIWLVVCNLCTLWNSRYTSFTVSKFYTGHAVYTIPMYDVYNIVNIYSVARCARVKYRYIYLCMAVGRNSPVKFNGYANTVAWCTYHHIFKFYDQIVWKTQVESIYFWHLANIRARFTTRREYGAHKIIYTFEKHVNTYRLRVPIRMYT